MINTRSKTFNALINMVTNTTVSTGANSGIVTRRNTCHSVAPSTRAASSASRGIAASPAAINTIANPAHTHRYDAMIAGVINAEPSQLTPPYAAAKLSFGSLRVYAPAGSFLIRNEPSSSVVADPTTLPPD